MRGKLIRTLARLLSVGVVYGIMLLLFKVDVIGYDAAVVMITDLARRLPMALDELALQAIGTSCTVIMLCVLVLVMYAMLSPIRKAVIRYFKAEKDSYDKLSFYVK